MGRATRSCCYRRAPRCPPLRLRHPARRRRAAAKKRTARGSLGSHRCRGADYAPAVGSKREDSRARVRVVFLGSRTTTTTCFTYLEEPVVTAEMYVKTGEVSPPGPGAPRTAVPASAGAPLGTSPAFGAAAGGGVAP